MAPRKAELPKGKRQKPRIFYAVRVRRCKQASSVYVYLRLTRHGKITILRKLYDNMRFTRKQRWHRPNTGQRPGFASKLPICTSLHPEFF